MPCTKRIETFTVADDHLVRNVMRPQSVDSDPTLTACVPTRTTRVIVEANRSSPGSKKKYTPRFGIVGLSESSKSVGNPQDPCFSSLRRS